MDAEIESVGSNEGFARFCAGEADINNASVPIPGTGAEEDFQALCADNGVEYVELVIGVDAVSVVHNVETDFVTDLTMDELAEIWSADSDVTTWSDVRSEWPDDEISLFGLDPATHLLFPAG